MSVSQRRGRGGAGGKRAGSTNTAGRYGQVSGGAASSQPSAAASKKAGGGPRLQACWTPSEGKRKEAQLQDGEDSNGSAQLRSIPEHIGDRIIGKQETTIVSNGAGTRFYRQSVDGRLGTPLQSFASVARTMEKELPPKSPERAGRQSKRQLGAGRTHRRSALPPHLQLQKSMRDTGKLAEEAEDEDEDGDEDSSSSSSEDEGRDTRDRVNNPGLRRYMALPNIEEAKLSADLTGVQPPGDNPWIVRSGEKDQDSVVERLRAVMESRLRMDQNSNGSSAFSRNEQPNDGKSSRRGDDRSEDGPSSSQLLNDLTRGLAAVQPRIEGALRGERQKRYLKSWRESQRDEAGRQKLEDLEADEALDMLWQAVPRPLRHAITREELAGIIWPEQQHRAPQRRQPILSASFPVSHADELKLPALVKLAPERRLVNYAAASTAMQRPPNNVDGRPDAGMVSHAVTDSARIIRRLSPDKRTLALSHYLFGHTQMEAVTVLLLSHPGLTDLQLANNDLQDSEVIHVANTLASMNSAIEVVDVSNNVFTHHALKSLARLLRMHDTERRQGAGASAQLMKSSTRSRLGLASISAAERERRISLAAEGIEETDIPEDDAPAVVPKMDDSLPSATAGGLHLQHTRIRELQIAGNPVGNKGMRVLRDVIMGPYVTLSRLDIRNCQLTALGAGWLGEVLGNNHSLQTLKMAWNDIGAKGCRLVAEGLQTNSRLHTLDMSWCGIGDIGGTEVATMLLTNRGLTKLDLIGDGLGDLAALEMGRALADANGTLRHLRLHNNPIGWQGARKLLRATLAENIQSIELCGCHLLHRPGGATEFDPRFPWGEYQLDLATPADRAVAFQLAEVATTDALSSPRWVDASIDGRPFRLPVAQRSSQQGESSSEVPVAGHSKLKSSSLTWGLPPSGHLRLRLERTTLSVAEPEDKAVKDSVLQAMWEKSATADKSDSDDWRLQLLKIITLDYFFTVEQLIYVIKQLSYPSAKVEAAVKLFGRLINPQEFHLVAESNCMPEFSLASLHQTLGMASRFLPGNPTGRYDLILSLLVDNTIAWRLLTEYRRQHQAALCTVDEETGFRVCCWSSASINGRPLEVNQPHEFSIPRTGLLKVNFVDLRPASSLPEPLGEVHFRCLLGYLLEASPLDIFLLRRFLLDPDLQLRATRVYGLGPRVLAGDLRPGGVRPLIKDLTAAVSVLRAISVDISLTCKQICRLLKLCSNTALVAAELMFEVVSMFWGRCVDREHWSEVLAILEVQEQVRLCQLVGYCAIFNKFNPCMPYELRLWRKDELYVARALHEVAASVKGRHPYDNCEILYAGASDWVSLEDALRAKTQGLPPGLGAIWDTFVGTVTEEDAAIGTTVRFDYKVTCHDSERAAASSIQRVWRAWRDNKQYLTLLMAVDIIKLRLLRMACRRVASYYEERKTHRTVRHDAELVAEMEALIAKLRLIMRRASTVMSKIRSDPLGLISRVAPGASIQQHRQAVARQQSDETLCGGKADADAEGAAGCLQSRGRLGLADQAKKMASMRNMTGTASAWEVARRELGVESITIKAFQEILEP